MTAHKILLLVLDGISDRPCPELGNRTPLQAALTPVLDRMARDGICGIMDTIGPGIRPGSDTSHLSLLGYNPYEYYTGRGPLEAEGSGIHMEPGMIGFRCNYATLDTQGRVTDRRAGRIQRTEALSAAIQDGVDLSSLGIEFVFRSGAGHRAALAFKGVDLGVSVTSNDPKKEGAPPLSFSARDGDESDKRTADALAAFVRQAEGILRDHPMNASRVSQGLPPASTVLIRGAGKMGHFEPFSSRYGLEGSVISAAALISGIGTAVGLSRVEVPEITGSTDTNLVGKVSAALDTLKAVDFVLMNIKGADEAGHDGRARAKMEFIEKIDSALAPLISLEDCLVAICADHSTPCSVKDHSADPVPVVICGEGVRVDRVIQFDEIACAEGGLHRINGSSLMPILMDLLNRSPKYGA
ncbi:MAG: 2,3-bisphosphoglycerate-independent phosphoglycerate mutase [Methanolinea sp.]|jgi:2,3-bisphosphoglycerate-independent phosphoglycerate mutase|nr:2,3-bisphosphoglycerate-independent phosphoglycerate mutase [Methanolinea sp.]